MSKYLSLNLQKKFFVEHRDAFVEHLEEQHQFLPNVSVDCVIFGFHDGQLKVLLIRFKNTDLWALPGGYIRMEEDMDEAAARILEERTMVRGVYLEQFYAFGQRQRVDKAVQQEIVKALGFTLTSDHWITQRFVTVGYFALVDFTEVTPMPDSSTDACEWFALDEMPELVFDHSHIVQKALAALRQRLDNNLIGYNLLPEMFTMQELQRLYETILGRKFQRANFQRKILGLGILERVEKKFSGSAHKAPYLYRFDLENNGF
ncbi:MAG: NUDIX domain-containing protein [Saprospiraceae bacterium]